MRETKSRLTRLSEKARGLPRVPGVYLMKDAKGDVIYVGKASSLPERVSSYFVASADLGRMKQPMLELIEDFDVIECEGEWEALLTENRLIKDIQPRFNAMLKDDKTFPYLVITMRDVFPGVYVTRDPEDPAYRGAKVLGPFTTVTALKESVQMLQRVFKYRTCNLDIIEKDPKNRQFRPCLLHTIGQCTAPCADLITKEAYRDDIRRFTRFLESRRAPMIREMTQEMEAAAKDLDFERAAAIRDQIWALERLDDRGTREQGWQPETELLSHMNPREGLESMQETLGLEDPIRCIEGIDIAHLQGNETVGSKVCFIDGRPLKSEYRRYRIQSAMNDDYASIREVISRRYREAGAGHELFPHVILIDGGLGQLHAALDAFEPLKIKPPMVISLAKKEELIYVQRENTPRKLARNNAGLRLAQAIRDEAHRFAQHYHHVLRMKKLLANDDD